MPNQSLSDLYNQLKSDVASPSTKGQDFVKPNAVVWRNNAVKERDALQDRCCKRIILDIYSNSLPLDDDYKNGNMGLLKQDMDSFLTQKNVSGIQYLKSAYEKTKAPLLEFVLRSVNAIGDKFMEEAEEEKKNAEENNITPPEPKADLSDENVDSQIVDIKDDMEYDSFMQKLKKKTIDKIVKDVSNIINNKKEEKDMEFDSDDSNSSEDLGGEIPELKESTVYAAMNQINSLLLNHHRHMDNDMVMGMAIREATLNEIDQVFQQPSGVFKEYASNLRFNKGSVITESTVLDNSEAEEG